jgi:hypothetical protein
MSFTELEFVLGLAFIVVLFMYFRERDHRRNQRREFSAVLTGLIHGELELENHEDHIEIVKKKGVNNA